MEATLYDDNYRSTDLKMLRRPVTLDLDSPGMASKKQRLATILTSPDLNMLKLSSPELEKFIITQNGAITTTPTPTQFLFPKNVTEEQEKYAKGFVDMLARLHQTEGNDVPFEITTSQGNPPSIRISTGLTPTSLHGLTALVNPPKVSVVRPPSVDSVSSSSSLQGGGDSLLSFSMNSSFSIKEEQTVPCAVSPPLSPINLEDQERIKLERKRYRNRIAASKCRRRKLERISKLEKKVQELKDENTELGAVATRLREQVCNLKQEVLEHAKRGCQIMVTHAF